MAAVQQQKKWSGSVTEVISAPVDKVWAILGDFDGLAKHFPEIITSCETTEGERNKVGSVRTVKVAEGDQPEATERLSALDNEKHTFINTLENHSVVTGYKVECSAETQVNDKTLVLWKFEADPNTAMTEEIFVTAASGFARSILTALGKKFSQ